MRGRKPKPVELSAIDGNPGHHAIPHDTPRPAVCLLDAPAHLSPEAAEVWQRLGPRFAEIGLMTGLDECAFAIFCQSYSDWQTFRAKAAETGGAVIEINRSQVPNPWLTQSNRAGEVCRKFLVEFGGSPSSRSRIHVTPPDDPGDSLDFEVP